MKTKQTIISPKTTFIFSMITILFMLILVFFLYLFPKERRTDYKRLSSEVYNTVFLSMYPTDHFYEEDFAYWRGQDIIKASYEISNYSILENYLDVIARSGNVIQTIYLGVLPEKISAEKLATLLLSYPSVHFEIILPNPSLDYWLNLSDDECIKTLDSYRDFILPLLQYENMSLYYFGATEWLICNSANYCDDFQTSETASLTIMLNSDRDHAFLLDVEKAESQLDTLTALIEKNRSTPPVYPDLSDSSIIFLGDSVIGNYSGSTSIPGVVEGLTGAQVFNFGIGGSSAAKKPDDNFSITDITNALITQDFSNIPLDIAAAYNASFTEHLSLYLETETPKDLCFVINYGLNDYYSGFPIASEDPYDIYTYSGAIRTSINKLKTAFPNATILLMTPNFTSYYNNGTEYRYDATHTLEDYTDALITISQEQNVLLLDNFNELNINANNHFTYLSDGCHPNETGRFLIGQRISLKLGTSY